MWDKIAVRAGPKDMLIFLTCSSHLSSSPFPDLVFRDVALGLVWGMSKFQSRLRDDVRLLSMFLVRDRSTL
jgi:hypothetical protein